MSKQEKKLPDEVLANKLVQCLVREVQRLKSACERLAQENTELTAERGGLSGAEEQQAKGEPPSISSLEAEHLKSACERLAQEKQAKGEPPSISSLAPSSSATLEELDRACSLQQMLAKSDMSLDVLQTFTHGQMESFMRQEIAPMLARTVMEVLERTGLKKQGLTARWGGGESAAAAARQSTRSKFRQTAEKVVGAQPKQHWREDWPAILRMGCELVGRDVDVEMAKYGTLEMYRENEVKRGSHESTKAAGFTDDEADILNAVFYLPPIGAAMGKALQEGGTEAERETVAAAVHALTDTVTRKAREDKEVAPKCYIHLTDTHGKGSGLADLDPGWRDITTPDEHGFRGMTTSAPLVVRPVDDDYYSPEGLQEGFAGEDGYLAMASPVVCFESGAAEDGGRLLHSAVDIGGKSFVLPPLTLIEVVDVQFGSFEYMPAVYSTCEVRLITGASSQHVLPQLVAPAGGADAGPAATTLGAGAALSANDAVTVTVPASVTLHGSSVHPGLMGEYHLDPGQFHEGRPCYHKKAGGGHYLYYHKESGFWYVENQIGGGGDLSVRSTTASPAALVGLGWLAWSGSGWANDAGMGISSVGASSPLHGTLVSAAREVEAAKIIHQDLIVVRPTFLLPADRSGAGGGAGGSKFASDRTMLAYGAGAAHTRGMAEITNEPVLTMEQEWMRGDKWVDWKGKEYDGRSEFEYAVYPVPDKQPEGREGRDLGRAGWTVERFAKTMNDLLRARAAERSVEVSEEMLLTPLEVVGLRLYTGPGYQPLNHFLREVSRAGDDWRKKHSHNWLLTYSSTVQHITSGLRKLVRFNGFGGGGGESVYRAVRGELPKSFWLLDDHGMVTATDFAFMSTSTDALVCQQFMDTEQRNVLWEVKCTAETSTGFHSGADVSALSQYAQEQEKLFLPLTMLKVESIREEVVEDGVRVRKASVLARAEETSEKGATFERIVVVPTFV